jgi:hypothetical protein
VAEAVAVAKARADNNQQRAVKTTTVAIAVGKRRQARGEKRRGRRGRRGGAWQRRQRRWRQGALVYLEDGGSGGSGRGGGGGGKSEVDVNSLTIESKNMHEFFRGEGSTYTNWRHFGANKSDASSECPNIRVPMFGVQTTEFYLCQK